MKLLDLTNEELNQYFDLSRKLLKNIDSNDKFWQDWEKYIDDCNNRVSEGNLGDNITVGSKIVTPQPKYHEPEYKIDDWVWRYVNNYESKLVRISKIDYDEDFVETICVSGNPDIVVTIDSVCRKATNSEVEKALIEYAEPIYKVGMKVKGNEWSGRIIKPCTFKYEEHTEIFWINNECIDNNLSIDIFTTNNGWTEIINPYYENSLGECFYYGDDVCWVHKNTLKLCHRKLTETVLEVAEQTNNDTEIMTKESAEKWIEENKPKNHLHWIFGRLIHMHGEKPDSDYMIKLKEIADKYIPN